VGKYIIRRVLQAIPVLFGISIVVYAILIAAPGGPLEKYANNPRVTAAQRAAIIHKWGLDQPVPIQYCRWLGVCNPDGEGLGIFINSTGVPFVLPSFVGGGDSGVLHGDLGLSTDTGGPVLDRIERAALPTLILAGTALIIWIAAAVIIGTYAAVRRYSLFDQAATIFAYVGYAVPTFWLGIMLIFAFGGPGLNILPAGSITDTRLSPAFGSAAYWPWLGGHFVTGILDVARHLVLPVFALVVVSIAGDSRFVRGSMLDALGQDYVRTARAKGLPARKVIFKHAFRNAMLPVVTNVALELPFLFTGALATEQIFGWPGIGLMTITAIDHFDYPTLMGILLISSVLVVLANLLADVVYAIVDPRISY
jgi:peptide/nickel transport system permease protein